VSDPTIYGTRISAPAQLIKAVIDASLAMHEARCDPPAFVAASAAHEAATVALAESLALPAVVTTTAQAVTE
jgi:hypothetical protein